MDVPKRRPLRVRWLLEAESGLAPGISSRDVADSDRRLLERTVEDMVVLRIRLDFCSGYNTVRDQKKSTKDSPKINVLRMNKSPLSQCPPRKEKSFKKAKVQTIGSAGARNSYRPVSTVLCQPFDIQTHGKCQSTKASKATTFRKKPGESILEVSHVAQNAGYQLLYLPIKDIIRGDYFPKPTTHRCGQDMCHLWVGLYQLDLFLCGKAASKSPHNLCRDQLVKSNIAK